MPELSEVETVRRGLAELLPGRVVARVVVFDSPKSFSNAPAAVEQFLYGARVAAVRRRAKVLMIDLDTRYSLVVHLKMTGQLVFRQGSRHSARVSPKKSRDPRNVAHNFSADTAREIDDFAGGHPNDRKGRLKYRFQTTFMRLGIQSITIWQPVRWDSKIGRAHV